MNMTYTNHSGGCEGADMAWENAGLPYGVKTIAYSFPNHVQYGAHPYIMNQKELDEGWEACKIASETLNRPLYKLDGQRYVKNLICRNWFQVKHADTIFAIGTLVKGNERLVNGGTGWAVQMALDNKKPVYLYEQDRKQWMAYAAYLEVPKFVPLTDDTEWEMIPKLTQNFAGIGTRAINDDGLQAILDVYKVSVR
tara:strand:- start:147 stop:734 length:588 start_codon:yes stop_codon:yes gene_type:complete